MENIKKMIGGTPYIDFFNVALELTVTGVRERVVHVSTKSGAYAKLELNRGAIEALKKYYALEIEQEKQNALKIINNSYDKL